MFDTPASLDPYESTTLDGFAAKLALPRSAAASCAPALVTDADALVVSANPFVAALEARAANNAILARK